MPEVFTTRNLSRSVGDSAKFAWNPTEMTSTILAMIHNALYRFYTLKISGCWQYY